MVNGFAIGGGHVLHVLCDLTIAADSARFGQTGPRVGSFDAGFGTGYLARVNDPQDIAAKILALLGDTEKMKRFGQAAVKRAGLPP